MSLARRLDLKVLAHIGVSMHLICIWDGYEFFSTKCLLFRF